MTRVKAMLFMFPLVIFFSLSGSARLFVEFRETVRDRLNDLEFAKKNGMVAAILAKELCSCLFVHDLFGKTSVELGDKVDLESKFSLSINQCKQRAGVSYLNLLSLRTYIRVFERTDFLHNTANPYAAFYLVVERRDPGLTHRFDAQLDQDPRYGCRMRQIYPRPATLSEDEIPVKDWPDLDEGRARLVFDE